MSADLDFERVSGKRIRATRYGGTTASHYRDPHDSGGSEWVSPLGVRIRCVRINPAFRSRRSRPTYDVFDESGRFVGTEPTLYWATALAMKTALVKEEQ